jgi:hypothetical protein
MIARFVLVPMVVALLGSLLMAFALLSPVSAQDPLPTPEGRLGGRMPLPTAEALPGGALPQNTPSPAGHPLVGTWLLTFAEPAQAAAQASFADDGLVTFVDDAGNRGAGVWIPSGQQSGVLALVVRVADASGQRPQIMMLQGTIDVGAPGDAATLVWKYTVETVDGSVTSSERAGPFTATGKRGDEQLIVPKPE